MATTFFKIFTRKALGSAGMFFKSNPGYAALVMLAFGITATMLSGCAMNPVQAPPAVEMVLNLGDATIWLVQGRADGNTLLAGHLERRAANKTFPPCASR